jgi:hypothetical protein
MDGIRDAERVCEACSEGFGLHAETSTGIGNGTSFKCFSANLQRLIRKD